MQSMFWKFILTVSGTLIGDNIGKGDEYFCDSFFDAEEILTSYKLENFDWILKFPYVGNVANNLKVVP